MHLSSLQLWLPGGRVQVYVGPLPRHEPDEIRIPPYYTNSNLSSQAERHLADEACLRFSVVHLHVSVVQ